MPTNYPFKQAKNYRPGRISDILWVVLHVTQGSEGDLSGEGVQNYFATTDRPASTQLIADSNSVVRSVKDEDTCYGAKGANAPGLHMEICGVVQQTPAQWADAISEATLRNAAKAVAEWCVYHDIPIRYLTVEQLKNKEKGITWHSRVEEAFPSSGHSDPGPHFPFDHFLELVKHYAKPPVNPLPPEEKDEVMLYLVKVGGGKFLTDLLTVRRKVGNPTEEKALVALGFKNVDLPESFTGDIPVAP